MSVEILAGIITNLPNLAGLLLLAWSQDRTITRLFKDTDRNEREIKQNNDRILRLESGMQNIENSLERVNITLRDLMLLIPRPLDKP